MSKKYYVPSDAGAQMYYGRIMMSHTEYDNYDDAINAAKKLCSKIKDDVTVYSTDSVVKFPLADLTVEKVD